MRGDVAAQLGDPVADPAPVDLDLGLTGAAAADADAARGATTDLPGQRLTPPAQAREQVVQLGQLDLRLALPGAGVLGEDVEDQRGPVDHLDLELVLEVAQLAGRELAVADHGVRAGGLDDVAQLGDLAGADVGGGVGAAAALDQAVEHHRPGGLGEPGQLGHRGLGLLGAVPPVQTPTRTTRSSRSWRYSTSVTSASSVDRPATRRSEPRSSRSSSPARGRDRWSRLCTGKVQSS